jgi:hypothetical protein
VGARLDVNRQGRAAHTLERIQRRQWKLKHSLKGRGPNAEIRRHGNIVDDYNDPVDLERSIGALGGLWEIDAILLRRNLQGLLQLE